MTLIYDYVGGGISKYVYKTTKVLVNVLYPALVNINETGIDENSDVIVSLTSFPDRIQTVWVTIATLLTQTIKPQKVLLWLAEDQFPNKEKDLPVRLLQLTKYGLTIEYCDNLYSHKKYYYTMKRYPDSTVITVDDDVLYPEYLIEELIKTSKKYPGIICCTWAHRITFDTDGEIKDYNSWESGIEGQNPAYDIIPVGCGGVLYPKCSLSDEVFNKNAIKKLCINADDLWLKMMANKQGTKAVRIEKPPKLYFTILSTQKSGLMYSNVGQNMNDVYLKNIIGEYPETLIVYNP